jgi:transcriptional regulator with XRE-family HTH domain
VTERRIPRVPQRVLAAALERHRKMAGLSREEAAQALGWSAMKLYRIETARVTVSARGIKELARLYGLDVAGAGALAALARQVKQPGWWRGMEHDLPAGFSVHLELESTARAIRTYEAQFVPGLWQTEDYARVVLQARSSTSTPEQVERQVEVRMRRQEILVRTSPPFPDLWAILDEAVIRRAAGSRAVMNTQLRRLCEVSRDPHTTLQILPFSAGAHMAAYGSFALFDPADAAFPVTASTDRPAGTLIEDDPAGIGQYALIFDHLRAVALNSTQSLALMDEARKLL